MQIIDFQGTKVRKLDNRMSAVDACRAIGYSEPRKRWFDLKQRNPELVEYSVVLNLRTTDGKEYQSDTLDMRGVIVLCMLARTDKAIEFRRWASIQLAPLIEQEITGN